MIINDSNGYRSLRESVYSKIKKKILVGDMKPGTRIVEANLAESLGVSRTPVREAIRQLEKEGMVTVIEPRRGCYISNVSVKDMVDILEVREELDALAASLAAGRASEEEIQEMEKVSGLYREAIYENDTENIIKFDEMFHKMIVAASGNKSLIAVSKTIQDMALRFRYIYYDNFSRYENMPFEHRHILEAIRGGDREKAKEIAKDHVEKLKKFVILEGEHGFKSE
ncbi:GntR family transcriptional regulator [Eubacteriales bacterium KG127]